MCKLNWSYWIQSNSFQVPNGCFHALTAIECGVSSLLFISRRYNQVLDFFLEVKFLRKNKKEKLSKFSFLFYLLIFYLIDGRSKFECFGFIQDSKTCFETWDRDKMDGIPDRRIQSERWIEYLEILKIPRKMFSTNF